MAALGVGAQKQTTSSQIDQQFILGQADLPEVGQMKHEMTQFVCVWGDVLCFVPTCSAKS